MYFFMPELRFQIGKKKKKKEATNITYKQIMELKPYIDKEKSPKL